MAITGFSGCELGVPFTGLEPTLTAPAVYSQLQARTGSWSVRCNVASEVSAYANWPAGAGTYIHFGLYVATKPSLERVVMGTTTTGYMNVRLTSTGALTVYIGATLLGTSSGTPFASAGWHWIGVRCLTGTSVVFLQVDGVDEVTATATVTNITAAVGARYFEPSAMDIYVDDMIASDSDFLAPSKVNLLLPISDNARAALWTGGALGTANLFDAVNNTPPIGTATETDLTQIEHAGGAAGTTDAYDADMTTYSTAGVGASDTVLAIAYMIVCGEDSATGTKLLNFSLVSNPIQASGLANFDVFPVSGALGTYSTNWTQKLNTVIQSPSVTVGTSPVMRVVRPETAARVASVCFMGMSVVWTPGVAAADRVPRSTPYPQLLAQ